jgi:hypothetical protein
VSGGDQCSEELILNFSEFFVRVWWMAMKRGTDTECKCVEYEFMVDGNIERN